jgi:hypothetical protein
MNLQNLSYALDQSLHNLGAVMVTGGALVALFEKRGRTLLVRIVLSGWIIQGATGALFGLLSYSFYGHLPDIAGAAIRALEIVMICAVAGILLSAFYLLKSDAWQEGKCMLVLRLLAFIALLALICAAFLRWFS